MTLAASCPDVKLLERLALGQLSAEETERLAGHAVGCPRCRQAVEALSLRQPGSPSAALKTVLDRLKQGRSGPGAAKEPPTQPSSNDESLAGQGAEEASRPFLSP